MERYQTYTSEGTTYVAEEEGLAVAAAQCRHKSKRTIEKYEHSSVSRQSDAVNSID
jgi:hypothetical protein